MIFNTIILFLFVGFIYFENKKQVIRINKALNGEYSKKQIDSFKFMLGGEKEDENNRN